MSNIVFLNGSFISASEAKIPVFDHGFLYGDGVYETIRIQNGKPLFFHEHWERLQNSCTALQINIPHFSHTKFLKSPLQEDLHFKSNTEVYQFICQNLITKNNLKNARLRITITRGENHFHFSTCQTPTVLIHATPLTDVPKKYYTAGVSVCTAPVIRTAPHIKHISMIASIIAKQTAHQKNVFETLFTDDNGNIREGSVSNILVISQKNVWIPPQKTILPGTMSCFVQRLLQQHNFQITEKNYTEKEILQAADEVYITNSLFGVLPVQNINNTTIKSPFPIYKKYFEDFWNKYF